jgi:major membrane immunogen (membrane-anchored lipoprotein)
MVKTTALLVAALTLVGCGSSDEESPARRQAREDARLDARVYCSMSVSGGQYSEEFKNCVADEVRATMDQWDRDHPED